MVKWTDIMAIAWRFILMNASCAENWFLIRKHQLILPLEKSLRDFWPFQFHYMCSEFFTYGQKHNAYKATINSYKGVKFLVVGKHFGQKLTALLWHYHCTPFARYPKESEIFNGWKMGFWWYIHDTCVDIDSGLQLINCINWSIHLKCIQTPLSYIWATILSRQKFLDSCTCSTGSISTTCGVDFIQIAENLRHKIHLEQFCVLAFNPHAQNCHFDTSRPDVSY